jgi:hypothetical protein
MSSPQRFPYPAFKDSLVLKPPRDRADFHFSSLEQDAKVRCARYASGLVPVTLYTQRENGIAAGYSLYKMPRFPPGKLDPRINVTAAPDVTYETDTGPKSGVSRAVECEPTLFLEYV